MKAQHTLLDRRTLKSPILDIGTRIRWAPFGGSGSKGFSKDTKIVSFLTILIELITCCVADTQTRKPSHSHKGTRPGVRYTLTKPRSTGKNDRVLTCREPRKARTPGYEEPARNHGKRRKNSPPCRCSYRGQADCIAARLPHQVLD